MKKKETIRSLWTPTARLLCGARRVAMLLLTTLLLTMTAQTAWAEDGDIYYEVRFWFESGATIQYQDLTITECGRILYRFGKVGEKQEVTIIPPEGKEVSYASCSYIDESDKQHVDYMDEEGDNVWSFTVESIKQNNSIPLVIINISFMNVNSTEPQQPSTDNVLDGTEESLAPGTYFCKESITYNHSLELGTDVSIFIAQNATLTINSSDGSGLSAEGRNINIIGLDKETSLLNITSTGENSTAITAGGIILHNLTVNATSGATVIKASDNLTINSSTVTATTTNDYGIYAGTGAINVNLGPTDFLLASSFNKVLTIPEGKELLAIGSDGSVSGIFKYGDTNLDIINGKTLRAANYCGSSSYNGKDLVWYLTTGSDAAKTLHIEKNPEISGSDLTIYNFENTFSSVKNSITQILFSDDIVGIGASAFSGFNALDALTLGSGVKSIGAEAFSGCKLLTELTIPDNVTTIGVQAFFGCGLTTLTIPGSVTTIGEQAFSECESLASATIPNKDGIASNIFERCTNLKTLTISGGSGTISASNPAKGSLSEVITTLIIGDYIEGIGERAFTGCSKLTGLTIGNNVTSIGEGAFSGCELLTTLTIPDNVTTIGASAFSDCSALATLNLGSGVKSIGASAFSGCKLLTELTIPGNVTTIGVQAFFGCGLTTLTIPGSVTTIGEQAFSECESLASATIPNKDGIASNIFERCTNLKTLTISGGSGTISAPNPAKGSLSEVITTLIIGNDIKGIGERAFTGCSKLTGLTIGNNVTSIGEGAFSGCELLTALTIPDNVTTIGASAFSGCSALATLTLGSGVESIGASAFSDCVLLTELEIPGNVTTIGVQAFSGCGLTTLTIPVNVTTIGEQAFSGCEALASATIPNKDGIASNIFNECTNLKTLTINGSGSISAPNPAVGSLSGVITTLTIGNDIKGIGDGAFADCSQLTTLNLGSEVASIGASAFSGCGLTTLTIPYSVTSIGASAFSGCSALATLNLGSSVREIGNNAFQGCGLTELTIPDNVTSIGASAFSGCSALATLTLGSSVTEIGNYAFSGCGLTTLTIPDNVMSIGDYAFQNAFADNVCKVITMEGETPPTLGNGPFTDSQGNYIILVPEAAYSVYCDDNSWAQYNNGDWITPQTITIKTYGGWASYCHKYHIGYDVTTESASAKVVTGLGEAILVEDQTNILPYDPVLINYTGQDDGQVILTANVEAPFNTIPNNTTWGGYSTVSYDSNLGMVQAYSVETITIQGNPGNEAYASGSSNNIFAISDFSDTQSYVLRNGNFVAVDKDGGIGAHRCWLNVKKSAANGARLLSINTGGESSEIETTYFTNPANSSGAWYGLDGRKLDKQPTKKGLYIYNGKKHVIK